MDGMGRIKCRGHWENRTRYRPNPVGERLRGFRAQIAHNGGLGDEGGDAAGDPEGWKQAKHDVLSRIPFREFERFGYRVVESLRPDGKKVEG